MRYKYGLKPVTAQPTVQLASYYTSDLPTVDSLPNTFGHANLIQPHLFLNQVLGDCAIAGSIEEVRLLNACRGVTVDFTDKTAVENYEEITNYRQGPEIQGFNPDGSAIINPDALDGTLPQNPTDGGTDVHELFDYRQTAGIVDASGSYHKVVGYAGLTPGDFDELLIAASLFDVVGIGIQVPDYAQDQFSAGQAWHVEHGLHPIEGGHYIPVVGRTDPTTASLFTWGAVGGITERFYQKFNTVAVVALTEEMFADGKTIDGVDMQTLAADLPALNTGQVTARREVA
jgi:hypothetical protein